MLLRLSKISLRIFSICLLTTCQIDSVLIRLDVFCDAVCVSPMNASCSLRIVVIEETNSSCRYANDKPSVRLAIFADNSEGKSSDVLCNNLALQTISIIKTIPSMGRSHTSKIHSSEPSLEQLEGENGISCRIDLGVWKYRHRASPLSTGLVYAAVGLKIHDIQ